MEKIDELETKIGKDFIDPFIYNENKEEINRLRRKLKAEIDRCLENSF